MSCYARPNTDTEKFARIQGWMQAIAIVALSHVSWDVRMCKVLIQLRDTTVEMDIHVRRCALRDYTYD